MGIFKSKLLGNIANQFILTGFSYVIPILLIPFLINTIGIEKYGLINFALAFSFYFQIVNEWGFDLSNVPYVVNNRTNVPELSRIFYTITTSRFLLCCGTSIVYIVLVCVIPSLSGEWLLWLLALLRVISLSIVPLWFFRSMEEVKYITRVVIPAKTICIFPIFFVVQGPEDYCWVMFFYALECFVTTVLAIWLLLRKYHLTYGGINRKDMRIMLKESFPYFTSTLFMRLYQNSNTVILKFVLGDIAVGLYVAAEKLHNAYTSFVAPLLSQIFYPYFTRIRNFGRMNRLSLLIVGGNTLGAILLWIFAPEIIDKFIKNGTSEIIGYFRIFLVGILISVPANLFGYPYLGALGKGLLVNKSIMAACAFYVIGGVLLFMADLVSIKTLIYLLIATQAVTLIFELFYIGKAKQDVSER